MKYQNTKTGAVIDIKSHIMGEGWQALGPAVAFPKKEVPEQPQRKTGRKKNG